MEKTETQEFIESLLPEQRNYLLKVLHSYKVKAKKWTDLDKLKTHLIMAKGKIFPYEHIDTKLEYDGKFETWSVVCLLEGWYDLLQRILRENKDNFLRQDLGFHVVHHLKGILEKYKEYSIT